jgi:hypothetical protein
VLWALSALAKEGQDVREGLKAVTFDELISLDHKVCLAVKTHLTAVSEISAELNVSAETRTVLSSRWDAVLTELRHGLTSLTPTSHAFHMRLASKYADYYRTFEQRAVEQWVLAARFKSDFLRMIAVYRRGRTRDAAQLVDELSLNWRKDLPARLPGFYEIERTGSTWAEGCGDMALSDRLASRVNVDTGRWAPYAEDVPSQWLPPRNAENTVRFGFAAAVIPFSLTV